MLRDILINGMASSCIMPRKLRRIIYSLYGMSIHTSAISLRCFMGGKTNFQSGKIHLSTSVASTL